MHVLAGKAGIRARKLTLLVLQTVHTLLGTLKILALIDNPVNTYNHDMTKEG